MALLMIYHLTGGAWGFLIRRSSRRPCGRCRWWPCCFLPIAAESAISTWAQPDVVAASPQLQHQQFYLNPPFFWMRAVAISALDWQWPIC